MTESASTAPETLARALLKPHAADHPLEAGWTITIDALRETYLEQTADSSMPLFTQGLRFLIEHRYLVRTRDDKLEFTTEGESWLWNS